MDKKINIEAYFNKGIFVIPEYQRGYKWSVKDGEKESSLEFFINSLKNAYSNKIEEYFIEAVTIVAEEKSKVILVDGQQRTTTLFLLFAVLGEIEFIRDKMLYSVRNDSNEWLKELIEGNCTQFEQNDNDYQDIYYFKNAIITIKEIINDIDKNEFAKYIKERVFLLYNPIPEDKAVNTFIALNGLKAIMKDEELIKSDLLIKSSRIKKGNNSGDNIELLGIEWKINEDRGRLARNWDKWLYWWNKKDVRAYFGISEKQHPLYYLLVTYWKISIDGESKKNEFSFDNFKNLFIDNSKNAKLHFEGLRKLQKTFEDLYNSYNSHNFLGLILKTSSSKEDALRYFLDSKITNKLCLEEYSKWSLVEATHLEIINNETERIQIDETKNKDIYIKIRKAEEAIGLINEKYVYCDEFDKDFNDKRKEYAFRFLMLLNLMQDNKLERKFDFSIWGNRSLEHIYPKSKKDCLEFDNNGFQEGSVHCIGNLVLLYGRDNSVFGAKDFCDKKNSYFDMSSEFNDKSFKSRNLLHTISIFAKSEWNEEEIIKNKVETIKEINIYYGINK